MRRSPPPIPPGAVIPPPLPRRPICEESGNESSAASGGFAEPAEELIQSSMSSQLHRISHFDANLAVESDEEGVIEKCLLVCDECEYRNAAGSTECYSCSSPLKETDADNCSSEEDAVIEMPRTMRCVECSHLNFLGSDQCDSCCISFYHADSFVQEELFASLVEALGPMDSNDEESAGEEIGFAHEIDDDDRQLAEMLALNDEDDLPVEAMSYYSSILAPDFVAPAPSPRAKNRNRRSTLMQEYSKTVEQKRERGPPPPRPARREKATPPHFTEEQVTDFVAAAVDSKGWEPVLTTQAGDGVERFQFRGSPGSAKSVAVFQCTMEQLLELLWPLGAMVRFDEQVVECKLLKQISDLSAVVSWAIDVPTLGRRELVCGRLKGERGQDCFIVSKSVAFEGHEAAQDVAMILSGFLMIPLHEKGGIRCIYMSKMVYNNVKDETLLSRGAWNVLHKVHSALKALESRPPMPTKTPKEAGHIRKLTIVKIPVKLASERDKVANEILTSEQLYFQALLILGSFYVAPILHSALESGNSFVYETFQKLASATDALVPYNQALLTEIERRMREWNSDSTIGDVFRTVSRFESLYSNYIQCYEEMVPRLIQCEKIAGFNAHIKELKAARITQKLVTNY